MSVEHKTCYYLTITMDETDEDFISNIVICILNSVLSLITFAANFVILYAICKSQNLHSPCFILLCCLAFSDLFVGLVCQPFLVVYKIAALVHNFPAYCILNMIHDLSGYITSGASLLTLTAVSIDRLLAVTLHLRYRTVVTVPRVFQAAVFLWIFMATVVVLKFWISYATWMFLPLIILLLTLLVTTFSTFKIFQVVRRHQRQISDQHMAALSLHTSTVNVLKCRKSAITVLYIYGLFLLLYLPFCVTMIVVAFNGYTKAVNVAYDYVTTAVFINSFLNPVVYCWRIREIRKAVMASLRRQ